MSSSDDRRSVTLSRTADGRFRATNVRGGTLDLGMGADSDFTPVELLLAAIGGCSGIDVDILTSRRSAPDSFDVTVSAARVRDDDGNHLDDVKVQFAVRFPSDDDGDRAREVLPVAIERSRTRLCTVSRTVELPTPVHMEAI